MEILRKIFATPFLILFSFLFPIFFLFINVNSTILSSSKVKSLANEAGIYSQISGSIRESLIAEDKEILNEGNFFEELSQTVGAKSIQSSAEKIIDNFFVLTSKAPVLQIIFPDEAFYTQSISEPMYNQTVNMPANLIFVLNNFGKILLAAGILLALILIMLVFLSSNVTSARFVWLGLSLLFSSIIMFAFTMAATFYLPELAEKRLVLLGLDSKMLSVSLKMLNLTVSKINMLFYIELAVTFLVALSFLGLGNSQKKQKIGIDLK